MPIAAKPTVANKNFFMEISPTASDLMRQATQVLKAL
jgi:hypothetical protein